VIQKYTWLVVVIVSFWFAWWIFCWVLFAMLINFVGYDRADAFVDVVFWVGMALIPVTFTWLWTRR